MYSASPSAWAHKGRGKKEKCTCPWCAFPTVSRVRLFRKNNKAIIQVRHQRRRGEKEIVRHDFHCPNSLRAMLVHFWRPQRQFYLSRKDDNTFPKSRACHATTFTKRPYFELLSSPCVGRWVMVLFLLLQLQRDVFHKTPYTAYTSLGAD